MKGKTAVKIVEDKRFQKIDDTVTKIHSSLGLIYAQIEGLKQGVSSELASLSGLIGHAATRVEQIIYAMEQDGTITEEKMAHAYQKLQAHQVHLERIMNDSLPMEEKIKEVLKWNMEPTNVKMDMQQIDLHNYLAQNPDKLDDGEQVRLGKLAQFTEIELQILEEYIKREKEQPVKDEDPKVAGKK